MASERYPPIRVYRTRLHRVKELVAACGFGMGVLGMAREVAKDPASALVPVLLLVMLIPLVPALFYASRAFDPRPVLVLSLEGLEIPSPLPVGLLTWEDVADVRARTSFFGNHLVLVSSAIQQAARSQSRWQRLMFEQREAWKSGELLVPEALLPLPVEDFVRLVHGYRGLAEEGNLKQPG